MISSRAFKLYAYLFVFLITLVTFFPVVLNDFLNWDDYGFVVQNQEIESISWQSLLWMLTSCHGLWIPLTWFSHAVDRALWGLNPGYHHLTNAIIHAANALLVFALFLELTRGQRISEEGRYVAGLAAALLFALHPLRVESVAWVAERKGVLYSLFFLSSMIFYLKHARADLATRRGGSRTARNQGASRDAPTHYLPAEQGDIRTLPPCGGGEGGGEASTVVSREMSAPTLLETVNNMDSGFRRNDGVGALLAAPTAGQGTPCPYKGRARHARTYYALALLFCVLALLSKSMAVSLPAVLFLLDYCPLERLKPGLWRRAVLEKVPFFILSVGAMALNMLAFHKAIELGGYMPLHMKIMNGFYGLAFYLKQTLFPDNLLPLYHLDFEPNSLGPLHIFSALVMVGLTAGCLWRAFKGERVWAAVWFFYLITIAPPMTLFLYDRYAIQDRYTYLPTLGFWLLVGLGIGYLWDIGKTLSYHRGARAALAGTVVILVLVYGHQTAQQMQIWKNSETLWIYTLAHSIYAPPSALFGLGLEFEKKGELDRALSFYERARKLSPKNPMYISQVANVIAAKGDPQRALGMYTDLAVAYPLSATIQFHRGRMLALLGRDEEALAVFDKALAMAPRESRAGFLHLLVEAAEKDPIVANKYYRRYISEGYARDPNLERQLGLEKGSQKIEH